MMVSGQQERVGGRYAGLPPKQRIAAALPVPLVLAALFGWLLMAGEIGKAPPTRDRALHLFLIRPPPPPPPPHQHPPRTPPPARPAGGSPAHRPPPPARPDAVTPIVPTRQVPTLDLAPLVPTIVSAATITGMGEAGLGSGTGDGDGGGSGSGKGDGTRTVHYLRADWVRRPDRRTFRRLWPAAASRLRTPARVLLSCAVDSHLKPHDCAVLWSNQADTAYGRVAVAMMADALLRPVLLNGQRTDLPVLVPVTFVP